MPILLLSEAIKDRVLSPRVLLFSSGPWASSCWRTMIATMEYDVLVNSMHNWSSSIQRVATMLCKMFFLKKDVSSTLSLWSEFRMYPDLNEILVLWWRMVTSFYSVILWSNKSHNCRPGSKTPKSLMKVKHSCDVVNHFTTTESGMLSM